MNANFALLVFLIVISSAILFSTGDLLPAPSQLNVDCTTDASPVPVDFVCENYKDAGGAALKTCKPSTDCKRCCLKNSNCDTAQCNKPGIDCGLDVPPVDVVTNPVCKPLNGFATRACCKDNTSKTCCVCCNILADCSSAKSYTDKCTA